MSHFRTAVIQTGTEAGGAVAHDAWGWDDGIYELIATYDENLEVEPHVDETRDEALAHVRERIGQLRQKEADGESLTDSEREYLAHADDGDDELLDWYAQWWEADRDEEGNFLTTYNPKSKYDYYSKIMTLTLDEWVAEGRELSEEELRAEWREVSSKGDGFYTERYYLDRYGDEDTYVKVARLPGTWAVVTPDGEWHEPGKVGWWGMDSSTAESLREWADKFHERFVEPYDPETTTVAILDCHI